MPSMAHLYPKRRYICIVNSGMAATIMIYKEDLELMHSVQDVDLNQR